MLELTSVRRRSSLTALTTSLDICACSDASSFATAAGFSPRNVSSTCCVKGHTNFSTLGRAEASLSGNEG